MVNRQHQGRGLLNSAINNLGFEAHVPGYRFLGPGTKLQKRLKRGDQPINGLDAAARQHDMAYAASNSMQDRHRADAALAEQAWRRVLAPDASLGEKSAAWLTTNAMKLKQKLGMGYRKKPKKTAKKKTLTFKKYLSQIKEKHNGCDDKESCLETLKVARKILKDVGGKKMINRIPRIIPTPNRYHGGFLIPLFAGLSALGSLAGGAANVYNAVKKSNRGETKLGNGLFLKPYKSGYGLYLRPYNTVGGTIPKANSKQKLPQRALSNFDIKQAASDINSFRGVFMRNKMPVRGPRLNESAVVNLDDASGPGTHWVCYIKRGDKVKYYDSYGNLPPPLELVKYFGPRATITYNYTRNQKDGTFNCGHLCLKFLRRHHNL